MLQGDGMFTKFMENMLRNVYNSFCGFMIALLVKQLY